jgi:hypothetical protein
MWSCASNLAFHVVTLLACLSSMRVGAGDPVVLEPLSGKEEELRQIIIAPPDDTLVTAKRKLAPEAKYFSDADRLSVAKWFLVNEDGYDKATAIGNMRNLVTEDSKEYLRCIYLRNLRHPEARARDHCLGGLLYVDTRAAVEASLALLDDEPIVRDTAAYILAKHCPNAVMWQMLQQYYNSLKGKRGTYHTRGSFESYFIDKSWDERAKALKEREEKEQEAIRKAKAKEAEGHK